MSTNTMYAKSVLLFRFRNIYWGTMYIYEDCKRTNTFQLSIIDAL